ncbi:hypothetical protein PVAP13_5NG391581 [Panicum virgatum]|uniref:Uncharacterized protein n=1 Tax=Panicum virgatum TaxID=38727 RepID=A0A8T0RRF4_PANVG|nr:hypothetical protein PVAP13_5NG391581 [Panicum virgatum]
MSQEEKNAICLRQREVRQKNKGDRCVTYLWCYKYITFGLLNTSTSFVTFSHIFLLWYRNERSTMPRVPRIPFEQLELNSSFATLYSYICTNYL